MRLAHARHELRRVAQTRRTFDNWPTLLREMTGEKLGRGAGDLEFVTHTGLRLSCPNVPGARLAIYEQFADDCYRLDEFLAPLRGRPFAVFDIGAHVGAFAVNVATLYPQARVDCFEPSPPSVRYLRRNIEQNELGTRVSAHEVALADTAGTGRLDDNDGASVHNGLMRADQRLVPGVEALAQRHAIEVSTTTFDAAVAAAPAPPEVIKLDCEGGEYPLVYASTRQSWASVSRLVLEYHAVPGESWPALRTWFADAGLHVQRDQPVAPGLGTAWLTREPAAS